MNWMELLQYLMTSENVLGHQMGYSMLNPQNVSGMTTPYFNVSNPGQMRPSPYDPPSTDLRAPLPLLGTLGNNPSAGLWARGVGMAPPDWAWR